MVSSPAQLGVSARASARDALTFRGILETVDEYSCPRPYNFHLHTVHSDGQLSPEAVVNQAIDLGLKEFAITDHHTVDGYWHARAYLEDWQWRHPARLSSRRYRREQSLPRLWVGVEVTSRLADVEVHILGYAFDPDHDAMQPYLYGGAPQGEDQQAARVIQSIQQAGGLAVLAHPCRYRRSPEDLIAIAVHYGIDGIETYYAYDNPPQWRPCPKRTPTLQHMARAWGLLSTCGTDTHGRVLTRRL